MKYIPNKIPALQRRINILLSIGMISYGALGIYLNDVVIPLKRRARRLTGTDGIHLHDEAALLMVAALFCGSLVLLSVVIDHYDERDNEHKYRTFAKTFKYLGWSLFALAILMHIAR